MGREKWRKKIVGFIDRFGFYIILLICLGIIGVTALLTRGGEDQIIKGEDQNLPDIQAEEELADNAPGDDIDLTITDIIDEEEAADPDTSGEETKSEAESDTRAEVMDETDKEAKGEAAQAPVGQGSVKTEDPGQVTEENTDEDTKEDTKEDVPASAGASNEEPYEMTMPADGEVIRPCFIDQLVYSPTLREWTTHPGIDIAGPLGGEVRAALDVVVESIEEDSLRGIVITLSHDNNLKTVYMGLSTGDMVREGQQVQQGQVISGIGRTAAFEILDDAHVHFEVLLDGKHQDPAKYLKFE